MLQILTRKNWVAILVQLGYYTEVAYYAKEGKIS